MSGPAPNNRWRFWLAGAALFVLVLWLLNDILLPFVVGAVVAEFVNADAGLGYTDPDGKGVNGVHENNGEWAGWLILPDLIATLDKDHFGIAVGHIDEFTASGSAPFRKARTRRPAPGIWCCTPMTAARRIRARRRSRSPT